MQVYKIFISIEPHDQVIALLSSFRTFLNEDKDVHDCMKTTLFGFMILLPIMVNSF